MGPRHHRHGGIVCTNATYHGNSEAVGKMTRIGTNESRGGQNSGGDVRAIPFPEMLRPIVPGASESDLAEAYLERLRGAIRSLEDDGTGFAGLIVCPIFANEGLPDVPRGFMARAAEVVRAAGGYLIADEVQAGYCRTGRWWGYEGMDFTPDIVVTGKPMGNGLPLAATAASKALVDGFRARTRYFNTFASSPLQAAVGMAVIDVIERDKLGENVARVGASLKAALGERKKTCAAIGDVRGHGLFIGVEMVKGNALEPDIRPGDRSRQQAQGPRLPHQQCRRLPQRRQYQAAAGIQPALCRRIPHRLRCDACRAQWLRSGLATRRRRRSRRRHARRSRRSPSSRTASSWCRWRRTSPTG